jgi:hypothetical protein
VSWNNMVEKTQRKKLVLVTTGNSGIWLVDNLIGLFWDRQWESFDCSVYGSYGYFSMAAKKKEDWCKLMFLYI